MLKVGLSEVNAEYEIVAVCLKISLVCLIATAVGHVILCCIGDREETFDADTIFEILNQVARSKSCIRYGCRYMQCSSSLDQIWHLIELENVESVAVKAI